VKSKSKPVADDVKSRLTAMPLSTKAQHILFQCQLWHLRRALEAQRARKQNPNLSGAELARVTRCIRLHERFVNAITPFVIAPLA